MNEELAKLPLATLEQAIKSFIYLNKIQELNNLIENFNLGEAPIVNSICILKNTVAIKVVLPARIMFCC